MEELDLKELLNIFWSRKIYMILITLIFILVGVVYTMTMVTPKYESYTTISLVKIGTSKETSEDSITTTDITLNQKLLPTYSEIIKQKAVLRPVIENLGLDISETELEKTISIKLEGESEIIKIRVINDNPEYAALIANEVAKVFTEKVTEMFNINNIYVLDKAEANPNPYNINHVKDIIIFAFIGIVVSVVYALIANMLDTTIKTTEDIEKHTKLTVLAEIPLYESELPIKKGGKR